VETVEDEGEETEPDPTLTPGNESDNDASVEVDPRDNPQDDTLGSFNTAPIIVTDRTGEFRAMEEMCRIILSSRSPEGQALFCGNLAHLCTRRTHQVKQSDGSDQAVVPGVYEGVLNSSRKIVDGIVESFVSFEDRAAKSKVNLNDLEQAILKSIRRSRLRMRSFPQEHPLQSRSTWMNRQSQLILNVVNRCGALGEKPLLKKPVSQRCVQPALLPEKFLTRTPRVRTLNRHPKEQREAPGSGTQRTTA
jgi:hypothetical protein